MSERLPEVLQVIAFYGTCRNARANMRVVTSEYVQRVAEWGVDDATFPLRWALDDAIYKALRVTSEASQHV